MYRSFCMASKNNFPCAYLVEHFKLVCVLFGSTVFIIGLPSDSRSTIKGLVKLLCLILSCIAKFRVPKYAKFGAFYAKIVQMTPQRLRRESLRLQTFLVNKQGATLTPEIFSNKHSFVLTFFATNTILFTLIVNIVNLN